MRRYSESAVLGVGGMGKVLLAHDTRIGRDVALKQVHAGRPLSPSDRARFLREARVQGQLEHPSIVPVYDIEVGPDGSTFFTMRRVLGRTLHEIIGELRGAGTTAALQFSIRELLNAFATICLTVEYAHSRGVIHRDLKPANVMLGDFGEVYVLDWGLAQVDTDSANPVVGDGDAELSQSGALMGTPLYMAPEQATNACVGPEADVFALGAMLFELLTLRRLRTTGPSDPVPDLRAVMTAEHVDRELQDICCKATEIDPRARLGSARGFHDAISRYLDGFREREQRRRRAAGHVQRARHVLEAADESRVDYEDRRGVAMRELVRTLAIDPANPEGVAELSQMLREPPTTTPPKVAHELADEDRRLVISGARYLALAGLLWAPFIPLVLFIGVRDWLQLGLVIVPMAGAVGLSTIAARRRTIPPTLQVAVILLNVVACAGTARMFGPLILTPTLLAAFTILIQTHPVAVFRKGTLLLACVAVAAPALLELFMPTAYSFEAGRMIVLPQMHELPRSASILLMTVASVGMILTPCIVVSRLRASLAEAQRQVRVQAWHFGRIGDDLVTARGSDPQIRAQG